MNEQYPDHNRLTPRRLLAIGAIAVASLAPSIYAATGANEHQDQERALQMFELDGELALGAGMATVGTRLVHEVQNNQRR